MKRYSSRLTTRNIRAQLVLVGAIFWLGASFGYAFSQEDSPAMSAGYEPSTLAAASATREQPLETPLALASALAETAEAGDDFDSDPLEAFNEKMFWFNREVLDRFLLKPEATAWDFVIPDPVQRGIYNIFDNLAVVRRVVNNALQLKFTGAATEVAGTERGRSPAVSPDGTRLAWRSPP